SRCRVSSAAIGSPRRSRACTTRSRPSWPRRTGRTSMASPRVAVVGATGAVGPVVLEVLHQRGFLASEVVAFASARSAGSRVAYAGHELEVRELTADALEGFDLALFSAGGG